jgi:ATP/maltotriose-dependent transcriptional regulator MalT
VVARSHGDYDHAVQLYEESLALFRELGNDASTAGVLGNLGFVVQGQGNYKRAEELFTEALELSRRIDDTLGVVISLNNLGEVAQAQGDYARAREYYEQGLALNEELGDKLGMVGLLNNLASLAHTEGDRQKAAMLYRQSLLMSKDLGHLPGIAECLEGLAVTEAPLDYMRAARLFGAAMQLRNRIGAPVAPNERTEYDRQKESLRSHLGPVFEAVVEAGKALTLDAAIKLAMETQVVPAVTVEAVAGRTAEQQAPDSKGSKADKYTPLTKRQVEVLRLVAEGCTDGEVATNLSLSKRTVHAHLHAIYEKLEVTSRNAAAHKAAELGLL